MSESIKDVMEMAREIMDQHAIALRRLGDNHEDRLPEDEDLPEGAEGDLLDVAASNDELYPMIPWVDSNDFEFSTRWVDYHDRGPRDVVMSGPLTGGWGPGRWMKNRRMAYAFCVEKYGAERVKTHKQSAGRWAFLIKNLRSE